MLFQLEPIQSPQKLRKGLVLCNQQLRFRVHASKTDHFTKCFLNLFLIFQLCLSISVDISYLSFHLPSEIMNAL